MRVQNLPSVPPHRSRQRGFTLLIVLLLISLMLVFVLANTNAIFQLRREVKLLEVRQQKHWEQENARATNRVARVQPK